MTKLIKEDLEGPNRMFLMLDYKRISLISVLIYSLPEDREGQFLFLTFSLNEVLIKRRPLYPWPYSKYLNYLNLWAGLLTSNQLEKRRCSSENRRSPIQIPPLPNLLELHQAIS